jgi:hypothetical protein
MKYFCSVIILFCSCASFLTMDPPKSFSYIGNYSIELISVERPESAKERYGEIKIDSVTNDTSYKYLFEDSLVQILWVATSGKIAFHLFNKTDHSIKIPWDEAAYVDENGASHRVMHGGIKYSERENPQPPSVVVRKGSIQDIFFPTDYVYYEEGKYGGWKNKSLFLDYDFHYESINMPSLNSGVYNTLDDFKQAVIANLGKTYQVLLPLQIQDVVNDYIFTFKVKDIKTTTIDNRSLN